MGLANVTQASRLSTRWPASHSNVYLLVPDYLQFDRHFIQTYLTLPDCLEVHRHLIQKSLTLPDLASHSNSVTLPDLASHSNYLHTGCRLSQKSLTVPDYVQADCHFIQQYLTFPNYVRVDWHLTQKSRLCISFKDLSLLQTCLLYTSDAADER